MSYEMDTFYKTFFRFLSRINCEEQLKAIQQTEEKKKMHFLVGGLHCVNNCSMWHHF